MCYYDMPSSITSHWQTNLIKYYEIFAQIDSLSNQLYEYFACIPRGAIYIIPNTNFKQKDRFLFPIGLLSIDMAMWTTINAIRDYKTN